MRVEMFYSDMAIIVYECAAILLLVFFIGKLSREKKQRLRLEEQQRDRDLDERLNRQLANERRDKR